MRILIPGGSGQVGTILARHLHATGHDVTVLSRTPRPALWKTALWDGQNPDPAWTALLEGADAVIHLSGRSVNCRYNAANRREIIDSRVLSTRLLGQVIQRCTKPPRIWMNASTSTFFRDARDRPMDEHSGELGGNEANVPETWRFSIDVARQWEDAFYAADLAATRRVALRSSMTMSPDPGGVFRVLLGLVRAGLGGTEGDGGQYVSWIHETDLCRAVDLLLQREDLSGPVNLTSPHPLPNRDFLRDLRRAAGIRIGLPATRWMLEIGAFFLRTETELILKSRRVVPTRLLESGFTFRYPDWPAAAQDLVRRTRLTASP